MCDGPGCLMACASEKCLSAQVMETYEMISAENVLAATLQQQSPIHSYLFDQNGMLITANHVALAKLTRRGILASLS